MPEDFAAAYRGVLDAVSAGTLSEDRIDQSVMRIVKAQASRWPASEARGKRAVILSFSHAPAGPQPAGK